MTTELNPSGHNKPYYEEEEQLLISLKQYSGLSWAQIASSFNNEVPNDRQRSVSGLENKWRSLQAAQRIVELNHLFQEQG
ncbi:hypothetical protein PEXP_089440 [Penicillium expansum]|nr:hypothetical protein PEXP_089440 [Penicillium expansum]